VLRGALERDGRQMSTSAVEADSEMERNSGLTADQSPRQGARRASRPPWVGFEARHPGCKAPMVINLVGCGSAVWTAPPSKIGGPPQSTQFLAVSHAEVPSPRCSWAICVHPLREIGLVAADRTQRLDQVGDRVRFDEVTARPASRAAEISSREPCMVTISTSVWGRASRIWRVASSPLGPGMLMSITTTSGRSSFAFPKASGPLEASPQTSHSVCASRGAQSAAHQWVIICDQHAYSHERPRTPYRQFPKATKESIGNRRCQLLPAESIQGIP